MQNTFGLKDFVILTILIAIGVSIWLSMFQEDRRWNTVREVDTRVQQLARQISLLERRIEEGVVVSGERPGRATRDVVEEVEWAVPDVQISWQERPAFVSDPRNFENFDTGGTFIEIYGAQPPTITPLIYRDVYGGRVIDQVVQSLATYHPETLDFVGLLAEAWQLSPDGLWLRVKIWDDARFSDGEPVTADDVLFTYELFNNPEIESERFRAVYDMITDVTVIDTRVVEFTFADSMFLNKSRAMGFGILPKHFYEQFTPSQFNESTGLLMGSGPFRVRGLDPEQQYRPGRDDIVLERNEQYWGPRPPLDQLRFKVISEDLAQLTDFNNRNADMMEPSPRQFARFRDDAEWLERNQALMWYNIRTGYSFIAWNGAREPFNDPRVRRAMTHLIDRERVIRNILEGIGEVATGPFNPRTEQANPNIEPWPYDLDEARRLLAEAGWTPGEDGILRNARGDRFQFKYTIPANHDGWRRIANYLRDQCALVGITCEVDPRDWAIFVDMTRNRDFDAMSMAWSLNVPETDPNQIWHSSQIPGGGDNFVSWNNPRADELIEAGRRELDHDKRMEIWNELHALLHEEQPYTFMVFRPWLRFINKRTENVNTYLTGLEPMEFFMPIENQASPF